MWQCIATRILSRALMPPEELNVLEGTGDAKAGQFIGAKACDVAVLEVDTAAGRVIETRDAVENRRLASPIGADGARQYVLFESRRSHHRRRASRRSEWISHTPTDR